MPLSNQASDKRRASGFEQRKLVAIGHSLGGTGTSVINSIPLKFAYENRMRAAIDTPIVFDGVIPIDPVIHSPALFGAVLSNFVPSAATISRRVTWPNRCEHILWCGILRVLTKRSEAAMETFKSSSFFQKWDPKVLEAYVEYGIGKEAVTATSGGVGLKTSSYQVASLDIQLYDLI